MKNDKLKQFVSLREQLLREKNELVSRLVEINQALGQVAEVAVEAGPVAAAPKVKARLGRPPGRPVGRPPGRPVAKVPKVAKAAGGKRPKNVISLKEAVLAATKAEPLSRQDILKAVTKAGYIFSAKDPLNSLSTLLYSDKGIKNTGGKFGPA
jgi:hypothetical protein